MGGQPPRTAAGDPQAGWSMLEDTEERVGDPGAMSASARHDRFGDPLPLWLWASRVKLVRASTGPPRPTTTGHKL